MFGNESSTNDFDIKLNFISTIISLEAKVFNKNKSNKNSTKFLTIFGKIIKARYINNHNKNYESFLIKQYGFLFDGEDIKNISHYFSSIERNDWISFCINYNVLYVFIVKNNDFEVMQPIQFYDSLKNTKY